MSASGQSSSKTVVHVVTLYTLFFKQRIALETNFRLVYSLIISRNAELY
jgi:hypothetical protein